MSTYIYCRVSSVDQERGVSLDAQEQHLKKVSKLLGWKIKNTDKVVSSAFKQTPDKLDDYKKLKNKKIMFYAVDRFSRTFQLGYDCITAMLNNGNRVYFTREKIELATEMPEPEFKKNMNKFIEALTAAETESLNISSRVKMGKRYMRENGFFSGGRTPFGYRKVPDDDNNRILLIADAHEQKIIKFILACRTPGMTQKHLNELLADCNVNVRKYPIELDYSQVMNAHVIEKDLSYDNIALLLNDYELGNRVWTAAMVITVCKRADESNSNNDSADESYESDATESDSDDYQDLINRFGKKAKVN